MAYTTINKSTDYFNTLIWTGNGNATRSYTGVGFQPDLIWSKNRSAADNHGWTDVIRGTNKRLQSSTNGAEITDPSSGYLSSFDSDGFSVQAGTSSTANFNTNSQNYVAWNWKAGGAGSTNTDGSITSTVSANTTAGFSIVSYTGTGSQATVGHGLGATPKWIIVKRLQNAEDWAVYHASNGAGTYQSLNTTEAKNTNANRFNVAPTSSVFTVNTHESVNYAENYIAYCFAEKIGYSKFGKYTGNGNADGTFVYTGFKPAFVIVKRTDATGDWVLFDNKRPGENPTDLNIAPNTNGAEIDEGQGFDFLSNGFKIREAGNFVNAGGQPFIYMAFGQTLVGSNNIPCTAR